MIRVTDEISIDENEVHEEFMRSGGPGGQHVNKVSTAVQLRFDIVNSSLPHDVKDRLKRLGGNFVTDAGVLIIASRESRSREMNRSAALERLVDLIKRAARRPKKRFKTRPSKAAMERRLTTKKVRAGVKKARTKVSGQE